MTTYATPSYEFDAEAASESIEDDPRLEGAPLLTPEDLTRIGKLAFEDDALWSAYHLAMSDALGRVLAEKASAKD